MKLHEFTNEPTYVGAGIDQQHVPAYGEDDNQPPSNDSKKEILRMIKKVSNRNDPIDKTDEEIEKEIEDRKEQEQKDELDRTPTQSEHDLTWVDKAIEQYYS